MMEALVVIVILVVALTPYLLIKYQSKGISISVQPSNSHLLTLTLEYKAVK